MGQYNIEVVKTIMIYSNFEDIKIAGLSVAVPEKEVNVDSFNSAFGEEQVSKFKKMVGVERFRVAKTVQTASDLCFVAARDLLDAKKIDKDTIGALMFVTQTPDYKLPATACVLHKRLGLSKNCLAYDINLGCSGYVYGLQTLFALMQTSNIRRALLLVGDTMSKILSTEDRSAAMLFGDAGSATLLEKNEEALPVNFACRTDGKGYRAIITQGGACRNPSASTLKTEWGDGNVRSECDLFMNGVDVFNFTISEVPTLIKEFMTKENSISENYDYFVMHQANLFILKQIAKKLKVPTEKVPVSLDEFGNTSSASIPITIAKLYKETALTDKANKFLLAGFGVGLSWAITSIMLSPEAVLPIITSDEHYLDGGILHG